MMVGVGVVFSWGVGATGSFVELGVERAVDRDLRCFAAVLKGGELICYLAYVFVGRGGLIELYPI